MPSTVTDIHKGLVGVIPVGAMTALPAIATAQTITVPDEANLILLQVEAQGIRFTFDGSTPTPTFGWLLRQTTSTPTNREWFMLPVGTTSFRVIETAPTATGLYQFYKTLRFPSWG
jgi:hypothetical protein